jgi:hypothetical protein
MREKLIEHLQKYVDNSTALIMSDELLNIIGISKSTILSGGDELPEYRLDELDECQRIKKVLIKNGYINTGLRDAMGLWSDYSEEYAAGWLGLPEDDEELFDCIKHHIHVIYFPE